jgi:hypothetical protein
VGAPTDAARAEVLASREHLAEEVVRLEASARAAVDIPARLRRQPAKVGGAAAAAAFLLLGGPGRVLRGARRALFGQDADLPKSMLPDEVEATLRKMGTDGNRIRGTLEREFAKYLETTTPQRRERDVVGMASGLLSNVLRPVSVRAGKQFAERLFDPDGPAFAAGLRKARDRAGSTAARGASKR